MDSYDPKGDGGVFQKVRELGVHGVHGSQSWADEQGNWWGVYDYTDAEGQIRQYHFARRHDEEWHHPFDSLPEAHKYATSRPEE